MSTLSTLKKKYPLGIEILLIFIGVYFFFNFTSNLVFALVLFISATLSMYVIIRIWRTFTPQYGPKIIYFTTSHKWARKLIAGGSFTYYEYKDDYEKIGFFEPVSRFISLMIAFLGLSTSISKMIRFTPTSPTATLESMLIWAIFLLIIPIILTPIVPIIWTMEDLKLKSWNAKTFENWRVSTRYKRRFNSFIAIGTLSVGLGLTSSENLSFIDNAFVFVKILLGGITILIYPVAVLTFLYYIMFRGKINREVRKSMDIVTAKTILELTDPNTGEPLTQEDEGKVSAKQSLRNSEQKVLDIIEEEQQEEVVKEESSVEKPLEKLGKTTTRSLSKLKRNTIGRMRKKTNETPVEPQKRKYKGGSATRGLWEHDDED